MIHQKIVTVKLYACGCHFRCPYCGRLCEHPPVFLWYYMIGRGFCEWCVRWMPIEGGDRLGIAGALRDNSLLPDKSDVCPKIKPQK